MDLKALQKVSYGMYIVATRADGKNAGCIINTLMQVTSEEPIYLVICLNRESYTLEAIRQSGQFAVSVLSERTDPRLIGVFGFSCSRNRDKFAMTEFEVEQGLPLIRKDMCANLLCRLTGIQDMGTHSLVCGQLTDAFDGEEGLAPMTYAYYHQVIKGKKPKSAPTYQGE